MRKENCIKRLLLCLLLIIVTSCAGTPSAGDETNKSGGVGTIVSNPIPPMKLKGIIPDISAAWNDEYVVTLASEHPATAEPAAKNDFSAYWQRAVLNTFITDYHQNLTDLHDLGKAVGTRLFDLGLSPSSELQTITADEDWTFNDHKLTQIAFINDGNFVRFYFYAETIIATYLVAFDENTTPEKGILVYVSPSDSSVMMTRMVFDYSGKNTIAVLQAFSHHAHNPSEVVSTDLRAQCSEDASECSWSFSEVYNDKDFLATQLAFDIKNDSPLVCFGNSRIDDDLERVFMDSVLIDPANPQVKYGKCELTETPWTGYAFVTDDLITAAEYNAASLDNADSTMANFREITADLIAEIINKN